MIDIQAKAEQVYEQGFCVLEAVYSEAEVRAVNQKLDDYWEQMGSPPMLGNGIFIHPLATNVPELMPFYDKQIAIETMKLVLRDDVRLAHTGSRMSNEESAENIGWHVHYSWDAQNLPRRDHIDRILAGCYADGSSPEVGPLIVLPRKFNDPLQEPLGDVMADWPGQVEVEAPPGSVIIFDTPLWHTAKRGTRPGLRHGFGAHYQGWNNPASHPEDNACEGPGTEEYKKQNPGLRSLLERP